VAINIYNDTIKKTVGERHAELEKHFDADVAFYYGEMHPAYQKIFRDFVEKLKEDSGKKDTLVMLMNTPGGSVETVEKMVDIVRYHYDKLYLVIPDYAMSAGTIFCMASDKIYMDYSSSLGPIDPQVFNGKEYVPALGYLDQVEKLLEKAKNSTITQAEFLILQGQDLAMLSRYEQAKNLTITLLKKWLVDYKFKDWSTHNTTEGKKGMPVTQDEKKERAEEIAKILGDNKYWHSHGRMIGIDTLRNVLKLKVEDYSKDITLRTKIRQYNDLIVEYIVKTNFKLFLHSRNYF
jgi:hypothetical protein